MRMGGQDEQRRHDAELLGVLVARNLKAERARAGLSQFDLAHRAGIGRVALSTLETGERRLLLLDAVGICRALQVPLADLLAGPLGKDMREVLGVRL